MIWYLHTTRIMKLSIRMPIVGRAVPQRVSSLCVWRVFRQRVFWILSYSPLVQGDIYKLAHHGGLLGCKWCHHQLHPRKLQLSNSSRVRRGAVARFQAQCSWKCGCCCQWRCTTIIYDSGRRYPKHFSFQINKERVVFQVTGLVLY